MTAPRIWVPKFKIVEPKRELVQHVGLRGFWHLRVRRPNGEIRKELGPFPNLITDTGLNLCGTSSVWMNSCAVGTSNTTPATSDSQLGAQVAETATDQSATSSIQPSSPYYGERQKTWRFAQGAAAGNLAEIGVGTAGNPMPCFSRALILDDMGTPTTLTVQADEFLDATYILQLHPDESDSVDDADIGGVMTSVTRRASNVTTQVTWALSADGQVAGPRNSASAHSVFNGAIGAITAAPAGTSSNATAIDIAAYVSGDFFRDYTLTWGLNNGNFAGGIDSMMNVYGNISRFGQYQFGFDPPIDKDNTLVLSLACRHTWGRTTAGAA